MILALYVELSAGVYSPVRHGPGVLRVVTCFPNATNSRNTALRSGEPGGGRRVGVSAMQASLLSTGLRCTEENFLDHPISSGRPRGPKDDRSSGRPTLVRRGAPKTGTPRFVGTAF